MQRLDENIKKDVVEQLVWDSRVNAANVMVDVREGIVSLSGSVPTGNARLSAISDTWLIEGVVGVQDKLTVLHETEAKMPSDEQLKNRAKQALFWNADIDDSNIEFVLKNGVCTVSGSVDEYWKKWETEKIIANIYGIKEVNNLLTVSSGGDPHDQEIGRNIEQALNRNLYIDAEQVIVKVDHGNVILTGNITSQFIRNQAEQIATYTSGVRAVDNQLSVETRQ